MPRQKYDVDAQRAHLPSLTKRALSLEISGSVFRGIVTVTCNSDLVFLALIPVTDSIAKPKCRVDDSFLSVCVLLQVRGHRTSSDYEPQ